MNPLLWVLVGLVAYTLGVYVLRARDALPDSIRPQGPFLTVHTKRGRALLNWLAGPKRFWRAWSNVGVGIALVIMAGTFLVLAWQAVTIVQSPPPETAVTQPRSFLVIPGVNPFLPLSVAPEIVAGLLVGLVVHEGGHGILCRVEDIDIESMGLVFLALLPVGAFVQPDEESQRRADRGGRTRMFAAGVMNNFAVTAVAFALLFGPVIAAVSLAPGVAVAGAYSGSPAEAAGIGQGDRVTAVEGTSVETRADLDAALAAADGRTVTATVDGDREVAVERELVVVGTAGGNPAGIEVASGDSAVGIDAVNGTSVHSRAGFERAVENRTFARLSTGAGERVVPVGAYVTRVTPDGPLNAAGAPANATLVVVGVGGEPVRSSTDLTAALDDTEPGDRVAVRAFVDGEAVAYDVELGENPTDGSGFLGVSVFPGTSGLLLTDFGVESYPAGVYLGLLGGDGGGAEIPALSGLTSSALGAVYVALLLPLASFVFGIPNFPGFTSNVANFYQVQGPLSALGEGGVFLLANLLFWTGWINLQLGLFNCVPGYPLDGGRILRTSAEAVVSRLPVSDRHSLVRTVTAGVGLTMLASLLLMVFGPTLL
jgi:membrane-associated protease RseP (regulator of RpoE activity)